MEENAWEAVEDKTRKDRPKKRIILFLELYYKMERGKNLDD